MRVTRPFLWGKNPSKQNLSQGNPELINAGTNAVGPGNVSTSIFAAIQARTNKKPGSDIAGYRHRLPMPLYYFRELHLKFFLKHDARYWNETIEFFFRCQDVLIKTYSP